MDKTEMGGVTTLEREGGKSERNWVYKDESEQWADMATPTPLEGASHDNIRLDGCTNR